jgi:hypothetical protein
MKRFVVFSAVLVTTAAMLGTYPATMGADPEVPFKGRTEYQLNGVDYPRLSYIGMGHATHLGEFTAVANVNAAPVPYYEAKVVFTAANGDQVFFQGNLYWNAEHTVAQGVVPITGGTGRFENAHGEVLVTDFFPGGSTGDVSYVVETFVGTIQY